MGGVCAGEEPSPLGASTGRHPERMRPRAHPHHSGLFRPRSGANPDDVRLADEMSFLAMLAESELQRGHLSVAARLARQALDREAALSGQVALGPHYVLGEVLAERNDVRGATTALEVARERADATGAACCRVLPALALARVRHVSGDRAGAWATIHDVAVTYGDEPLLAQGILEAQGALWLREGAFDRAAIAVEALSEPARSRLEARIRAARGDAVGAAAALRGVPLAARQDQLEHLLVRARAAAGEDERRRLVHDALTAGEPDDYVRTFADEGAWILPSLRRLEVGWGTPYAAKLLAAASLDAVPPDEADPSVASPNLSPREWEVLGYLETRLSIREIGRELFISRNTVKSHIRSIYLKLGVQNRLQAKRWRESGATISP